MAKRPKRPRDPNQLAKLIVDLAAVEVQEPSVQAETPATVARRKGGLKGGKSLAKKLSARKRREITRRGGRARWQAAVCESAMRSAGGAMPLGGLPTRPLASR